MNARARTFTYDVVLDRAWTVSSDRGGATIANDEDAWTPEHLVLAGLCRCVLTSFRYHARRAGHEPAASAAGHGVVTRREHDGRFAFVAIDVGLDVVWDAAPPEDEVREIVAKGERDCFIGASLTTTPDYRWVVNGKDLP